MNTTAPPSSRLLTGTALFIVYIVWGSTYLGLRFALDGFPPFLLNGIRLLVAGGALYLWARSKGAPNPTGRQWLNSAMVGGLMFVGGLGLISIAEDVGVGSGVVAAAVAVMPLWAALWSGLFGAWPNRLEWLGLVVGFSGVALLSQEGDFQVSVLGTALVVVSPILWAFGSIISVRLDLPKGIMASAAQILGGGALLLTGGLGRGEWIDAPPSTGAWLALVYLTVAGSLAAYPAYLYLLAHTRPAVATSYAYVNPVVAIVLGITLGDEIIGGWVYAGLPVILTGVAIVGLAQRRYSASMPAG